MSVIRGFSQFPGLFTAIYSKGDDRVGNGAVILPDKTTEMRDVPVYS